MRVPRTSEDWEAAKRSDIPLRETTTTVAVLEALRDVRLDRRIIRPPRWIGTEAAHLIDGISKSAEDSWDSAINGYQFPAPAASVLRQLLEGTPRPAGNRLATFETPETVADRMRSWSPQLHLITYLSLVPGEVG